MRPVSHVGRRSSRRGGVRPGFLHWSGVGRGLGGAAERAATVGLLCALAVAVSFFEGLLPILPVPGALPGLSNIVTMAALDVLGLPAALAVTAVKGLSALLRGGVACVMSLAGGVSSTLVMALVRWLGRGRLSFIGLGVTGAAIHNMAQLAVAVGMLGPAVGALAPALLLFAAAAGIVTGLALNLLSAALNTGIKGVD